MLAIEEDAPIREQQEFPLVRKDHHLRQVLSSQRFQTKANETSDDVKNYRLFGRLTL